MTTIYTETSKYILDRAKKTISRVPHEGQGQVAGLPEVPVSTLRRDTETLKLHSMLTCEIGKPMEMLIDVREDGIATYRKTTIVRSIVDDNQGRLMCSCVGNFVCVTHKRYDEEKVGTFATLVVEGKLPVDKLIEVIFAVEEMYLKRRNRRV